MKSRILLSAHPLRYRLHKRANSGHMAQVWVSEQPELDGERFFGITERTGQYRKSRGAPLIACPAYCLACKQCCYSSSTFQALRRSDEHPGLSHFLFAVTLAPAVEDNC